MYVNYAVGGIRLVRAFANEKHESKLFHKDNYYFRDAKILEQVKGDIVYKDVRFGYTSQTILDGINMPISAGETVAFVGPSEAGKTTLCSFFPGFYEVQDGSITVEGKDIRDVNLASLRNHIGIVQQDVFLFSGTLRENTCYGKLDSTEEEIIKAAHRAELSSLIETLPEGLDTFVDERGVKLSGQRLSIARMFLKKPPILILEEAKSALDTETELSIQRALNELSEVCLSSPIVWQLSGMLID